MDQVSPTEIVRAFGIDPSILPPSRSLPGSGATVNSAGSTASTVTDADGFAVPDPNIVFTSNTSSLEDVDPELLLVTPQTIANMQLPSMFTSVPAVAPSAQPFPQLLSSILLSNATAGPAAVEEIDATLLSLASSDMLDGLYLDSGLVAAAPTSSAGEAFAPQAAPQAAFFAMSHKTP